ncbi:MAG: glucosamine-6-phosphate deaminase [Bacilli bacterium]|jgi:glucosamine-6-phosphate deaminase
MQVIIKKTIEEIADEVSEKFATLIERNPQAVLGLATGSTPIPTYQKLVEKIKSRGLSVQGLTTFNLDEYVDLKFPENSYRFFMEEHLFRPLGISPAQVHFPPEVNPEKYDQLIQAKGGIDLQILGIGSEGHIAFNEAHTPFDCRTHIVALAESTRRDNARFFPSIDDVPTHAVSMGLKTIMETKEIVLIATGAAKMKAVKAMLSGVATPACPASILNEHDNVTVYLDEEAAGSLY